MSADNSAFFVYQCNSLKTETVTYAIVLFPLYWLFVCEQQMPASAVCEKKALTEFL